MLGHDALQGDTLANHGPGTQESTRFNAVRDDCVLGSIEFFDAFDSDAVGAGTFDFGTHFDEEIGQILHLRFCGGTLNDGGAFG